MLLKKSKTKPRSQTAREPEAKQRESYGTTSNKNQTPKLFSFPFSFYPSFINGFQEDLPCKSTQLHLSDVDLRQQSRRRRRSFRIRRVRCMEQQQQQQQPSLGFRDDQETDTKLQETHFREEDDGSEREEDVRVVAGERSGLVEDLERRLQGASGAASPPSDQRRRRL